LQAEKKNGQSGNLTAQQTNKNHSALPLSDHSSQSMTQSQTFDNIFYREDVDTIKPPYVDGRRVLIDGQLRQWDGDSFQVISPIAKANNGGEIVIGVSPNATEKEAIEAVQAASNAFHGMPSLSVLANESTLEIMTLRANSTSATCSTGKPNSLPT
jgi:hypothetical protein